MLSEFENKLQQATKTEMQAVAQSRRLQLQLDQLQQAQEEGSNASADTSQQDAIIAERDKALQQVAELEALQANLTEERDAALDQVAIEQKQLAKLQSAQQPDNNAELEAALAAQQQLVADHKTALDSLKAEREAAQQEADSQRNLVAELQQQIDHLQQVQSEKGSDQPDLQQLVDQLRASNNMMKDQSSITANHQAEQRETIKQLRDELQQQRDQMQAMLVDKNGWSKQKQQLEEQVSFVKSNATATIERLTRYREQAQEKIEKLEQKLRDQQKDSANAH